MKIKTVNIFWGLILVLGGALFLAQNLGYIHLTSSTFWIAAFAGLSLLFLVTFFLSGVQHWGWLFPALIFGAVALTMGLADAGVNSEIVAAPIMLSVAIPFLVAFAFNPRQRWWALIPAWVMIAITGIVLFAGQMQGEVMGTFVLYAIALPFFVVYFVNRANQWALIPGGILAVIGLIPLLSTHLEGSVMGAVVMLLIALPFLVAFLASPKNWWALIPTGILSGIGIGMLFLGNGDESSVRGNLMTGVMFFVWAIAFGVLWLLRTSRPTAWARYPAVVMALVGLVVVVLNANSGIIAPLIVVAAGVAIVVFNLVPRRTQL